MQSTFSFRGIVVLIFYKVDPLWNGILAAVENILMENEKNKIKEPYTPENTPTPPQIIDPTERNGEHDEKAPLKAGPTSETGTDRKRKKPTDSAKEKQASAETTPNPGKEKR